MPEISSTLLPVASFTPGRQQQNLPFRPDRDSQSQLQNTTSEQTTPPRFLYRGEVLEQPENQDRRYRPQFNQDIDPQNRQAIGSYQQISEQSAGLNTAGPSAGRIVDFFI